VAGWDTVGATKPALASMMAYKLTADVDALYQILALEPEHSRLSTPEYLRVDLNFLGKCRLFMPVT